MFLTIFALCLSLPLSHRFVLVLEDEAMADVVENIERYRINLQTALNPSHVVLIEKIEAKRVETIRDGITIESSSTDVTFVVALPQSPYTLLSTNDKFAKDNILSGNGPATIKTAINQELGVIVETVRRPYNQTGRGKSYVWWMDDPWAALVALAAIIILLAIVGIIVIIFTHSR